MILGVGSDIVDIRRIEKNLEQFGESFETRIFTPAEQQFARARSKAGNTHMAATYAKRFAAKEACAKALGMGFSQGISWCDIEVVNDAHGAPHLRLRGAAGERLFAITPAGKIGMVHLSLSDDYPYALAYVVISAE